MKYPRPLFIPTLFPSCGFILLHEAEILGFLIIHQFKVFPWKMVGPYFSYHFLISIVRTCFPWNRGPVARILMIFFPSGFISLYFFWTVVLGLRNLADSFVYFFGYHFWIYERGWLSFLVSQIVIKNFVEFYYYLLYHRMTNHCSSLFT